MSFVGAQNKALAEGLTITPDWLTINGSHRTRFEVLDGASVFGPINFVDNVNGDVFADDEFLNRFNNEPIGLVSLQTAIKMRATFGSFSLVAEVMDSRSYMPINDGENCRSPDLFVKCNRLLLITTNALEPIQSYLSITFRDTEISNSEVVIGRFTMDIGSGRLIGRSDFRNTVQSYLGVMSNLSFGINDRLTLFYTLPRPKKQNSIMS